MSDGLSPRAKRVPPADVPPVIVGSTRIDAVHWGRDEGFGQNGGIIRATDAGSGADLWTLKLYEIAYDDAMESDVQDIFVKTMRADGSTLTVTDERRRTWVVDLESRSVRGG